MVDLQKRLKWLDTLQQKHSPLAFAVAIVKKYGEDQGGYQAALITYYGFLSLFPLLLVLTTLLRWLPLAGNGFKEQIIDGATDYFPIIGTELQHSVHGFSKTGLPLILGFLVLLYGARGVADAFRHAANNIWGVPMRERSGFLPALAKSGKLVLGGGIGFIAAAILASYAGAAGHDFGLRLLFLLCNLVLLFGSFQFIMRTALARTVHFRDIWFGAALATVGLFILQNAGGYIITHELKNLNNLYGTFAVVLGLFFWLYLQTQLIVYAMVADTVRSHKLWPRNLF
ncbi:MAG TPA: YihY/virulence factor BrkB family protein [Candidatus Saccharimonadales bacterium]